MEDLGFIASETVLAKDLVKPAKLMAVTLLRHCTSAVFWRLWET